MSMFKLWVAGAAAALCVGCESDGIRQVERTDRALVAAGDADSLAADALLTVGPTSDPNARMVLITRAVAEAPPRTDLLWVNLRLCSQVEGCETAPLEAKLRALDPSNGAAWIDAIGRAAKQGDAAALREALSAIGSSKRFDLYWNATVVHATNAMLRTHELGLPAAFINAAGLAAAAVIPIYQPILKSCKGDDLRDPDRLNSCRRVAAVMRNGDTYVTEMVGLTLAKQVWPEGSSEYADAVAARRVAHYRMETDGELGVHLMSSSRVASKRLALMTEKHTEQEVAIAEIASVGARLNPPADYREKWGS